jgi:hypothetical protein
VSVEALKRELDAEKALLKYAYGNAALDPWLTDQLAGFLDSQGVQSIFDIAPVEGHADFWYDIKRFTIINKGGIDSTAQDVFFGAASNDYIADFSIRFSPGGAPYWIASVRPMTHSGSFFGDFFSTIAPLTPVIGIGLSLLIPGLGSAIGAAVLGDTAALAYPALATAIGNTALSTALNGGNIEAAVAASVAGFAGGSVGGVVGGSLDSALIGKAAAAATSAAISGGDLKTAVGNALLAQGVQSMKLGDFFSDATAPAVDYTFQGSVDPGFGAPGSLLGTLDPTQPVADVGVGLPTFDYTFGGSVDPGFNSPPSGIVDVAPVLIPPPDLSTPPTAPSGGGFVATLTDLAVAAIKINQAYQAANKPQIRTAVVGAGGTTIASANGTVSTRNPLTGAVTVGKPAPGTPYALADGRVIINNGNGTFTTAYPDGRTVTTPYAATPSGAPSNTLLYAGLAAGAFFLLRK